MNSIADLTTALADRYTIERELGQGGMATVYLARDLKHKRQVAIKVLRADLAAAVGAERFTREVEIAARLQHPHILPLLDSGSAQLNPEHSEGSTALYYVMPYIDGESLRDRLDREGELPVAEASRLLAEIADALAHAHAQGVVHRDVKPENVMLSGRHALVMDFGIAKALAAARRGERPEGDSPRDHVASSLTTAGIALGTPTYMAPEQASADPHIDHRVDIYALGVVGYELLAGRPPFIATSAQQVLAAHVTQAPQLVSAHRSAIPAALAQVIMRALEKRPSDRWQSADEMRAQLESSATPTSVTPVDSTAVGAITTRSSRARAWAIPLALVLVAVAAVVFVVRHHNADTTHMLHTIAVLPLDTHGDTASQPFAEGISDGVRDDLSQLPGISVIGRVSSQVLGTSVAAGDVHKRLASVDEVMQGALSRAGTRLHLVAELDDAVDGHQLWGTTLDLDARDLYAAEDSIKAAIVTALRLKLSPASIAAAEVGRTTNPQAYAQYLIGRHDEDLLDEPDLRRALAHFDTALALDPTFAKAQAGTSIAWAYLADEYLPPDSAYPQMKAAALRAVQLDSTSAEAHAALADALVWVDFDVPHALAEFNRAVALDPNSAPVRVIYANILMFLHPADGVRQADRAVALDPLSPFASFMRAGSLYTARRYREAIDQTVRTTELAPTQIYYDAIEAASYRELGDYPRAVAIYRKDQSYSNKPLFGLGVTYARMGMRDSALRVAHDLEERSKAQYVTPALIAMIYANLPLPADRDSAFHWIDIGRTVHSGVNLALNALPEFDLLRKDPRFAAALRELNARASDGPVSNKRP